MFVYVCITEILSIIFLTLKNRQENGQAMKANRRLYVLYCHFFTVGLRFEYNFTHTSIDAYSCWVSKTELVHCCVWLWHHEVDYLTNLSVYVHLAGAEHRAFNIQAVTVHTVAAVWRCPCSICMESLVTKGRDCCKSLHWQKHSRSTAAECCFHFWHIYCHFMRTVVKVWDSAVTLCLTTRVCDLCWNCILAQAGSNRTACDITSQSIYCQTCLCTIFAPWCLIDSVPQSAI